MTDMQGASIVMLTFISLWLIFYTREMINVLLCKNKEDITVTVILWLYIILAISLFIVAL